MLRLFACMFLMLISTGCSTVDFSGLDYRYSQQIQEEAEDLWGRAFPPGTAFRNEAVDEGDCGR